MINGVCCNILSQISYVLVFRLSIVVDKKKKKKKLAAADMPVLSKHSDIGEVSSDTIGSQEEPVEEQAKC